MSACVTCMVHDLPKMATTGVPAAMSARRLASSSGSASRWRVLPNAERRALCSSMPFIASKKRTSFGLEPGQPPSM